MASNAQKTALARTLEQYTARRIRGSIALAGKALPASVVKVISSGIVTVKFEIANTPNSPYTLPNVTCPIFGPEWVRYPTQIGDKGVVFPADAYLGGVSGLGGGVADLALRGNLSALVFFPIGNKNWSAVEDPNALVLYGPDGVIIRNKAGTSKVVLGVNGVEITPVPGKLTKVNGAIQPTGNLQLGGQLKALDGSTYAQDVVTTGDLHGTNVVAAAMISGASLAVGTATIGGHAALTTAGGQNLSAGFTTDEVDLGTPANGSIVTPSPLTSGKQLVTNNVAGFTVASSGLIGDIELRIINDVSAGTITFSGFSKQWPGDSLDTTNGHQFVVILYGYGGGKSAYVIKALQ